MRATYNIVITALLILSISSCEKFTEGQDVNPNLALDAPISQRLTGVEVAAGLSVSGELPRLAGIWTNQFTGKTNQYSGLENYTTQSNDFNTAWNVLYTTIGANARVIQEKAASAENPWTKGVGEVLEAYAIGTAAALFGDVPYSQAFQPETFPNPKFDNQVDVYAAVQQTLENAVTDLSSPTGSLVGDFLYGGKKNLWIEAARSYKARYYLHTNEYQKAIDNALVGISSPANDLIINFPATGLGKDYNPYWDFENNQRPGYMDADGAYAISLMQSRTNAKTNETGRLNYYYDVADGNLNYNDPDEAEGIAVGAFGSKTSFPFISYVENQLILAECYFRLSQPDKALIALNNVRAVNAVNKNYQANGLIVYQPYVAADFATNDALLKEILTEKYLTLLGQTEVYNDARRKNNAALIGITPKATGATTIPQRLFLPQGEISTNPNTPVQTTSDLFVPTPVNK